MRECDEKVVIMFVTNLFHYAIKGYEVGALDFIVKPVNYHSFTFKLKNAFKAARNAQDTLVTITYDRLIKKFDVKDIYYIENVRHKLIYHTADGDFEEYSPLSKAEQKLAPYGFERCNSYYLVNLRHVNEIKNMTVIVGKESLLMSRAKKAEFISKLNTFIGARLQK